ncbi:MAG: Ig-like domain-containing protein [Verrucomicrobiota bacterium]
MNDVFTGSPGLVLGTHFVELGSGRFVVDLTSRGIHSTNSGVLLVTHGKNEDNYALSFANPTNGTWSVFVKDNGSDGSSAEQDPVAFVFIPKTNTMVVSGKFRSDGQPLIYSGPSPRFTVAQLSTGRWRLTIPGQSPTNGVLLISPEGGASLNVDNVVSYQPDGDGWVIESRDLPANPPGLQTPGAAEAVASFVFVPSVAATLVAPTNEAAGIGAAPQLQVAVPPGLNGPVSVTFYGRPLPVANNTNADFSIGTLPDTQFYSATMNGGTPAMFRSQTDWYVANRTKLNLRFVTHLGDITQRGQNGGNNVEWLAATNAMYRFENPVTTLLSNGIPYGLGVGNHDQSPIGTGDTGDTTFFNQFFGVEHFIGYDYYGGHFGSNNDNSFQFFNAGGMDFIIIHLEYDTTPLPAVLAWADNLLKTYPNHRAIVTSHWIVNTGFDATFSAQGQAIYNTLKNNPNFFLMLCGHIAGEGQRSDVFEGRTVHSILTDYQGRTNGGNGWLRYYTFSPSNNVIRAFTYSPWLDQTETDADSQFTLPYNMNLPGTTNASFAVLATNLSAVNGLASCVWTGLASGVTYEWYVVTRDSDGNTATSPTWRFSVANAAPSALNQSCTVIGDASSALVLQANDSNGDTLTFQTNTLPQHGGLMAFDRSDGAVTYVPVHGYRGTDRFTYSVSDSRASSSVASMNLTVIAPPDTNANGLPDGWEATYGLTDPNDDPDQDGHTNREEYLANTNPTNTASVIKIISQVRATNGHVTITWASVGGVRYRVQYSNGLNGMFTDVVRPLVIEMDAAPAGAASTQTFVDDFSQTGGAPASSQRFYRIKIVE